MSNSMIGIIAALGSTASWALCGVLFKKLGERLDPVGMTAVKSLAAALFLSPLLCFVGGAWAGGRDLLLLAASGIIGIAVGDCFFFAALGQLSPLLLTGLFVWNMVVLFAQKNGSYDDTYPMWAQIAAGWAVSLLVFSSGFIAKGIVRYKKKKGFVEDEVVWTEADTEE